MLKYLKGARILVDCETGELHVDLGDGNCAQLGSGSGCDLIICGNSADTVALLSGTYDALYAKLMNREIPNIVYVEQRNDVDGKPMGVAFGKVKSVDFSKNPNRFNIYVGDNGAIIELHEDNTVTWFFYDD